jgi:hypothetical protein
MSEYTTIGLVVIAQRCVCRLRKLKVAGAAKIIFGDDVDLNELETDFCGRSLVMMTTAQDDRRISEMREYRVIERLTIFGKSVM